MRSLKPQLAVAALLTAGLATTAPAAHAATVPPAHSAECEAAVDKADSAEAALEAAQADLKKQIRDGGHPGAAEWDNLHMRENERNATASDAARVCRDSDHDRGPVGPMHTGVGSTSQGADTSELAAGLGLLGAVGAGAVVLRRRRAGSAA
jgi:hypothetical protein